MSVFSTAEIEFLQSQRFETYFKLSVAQNGIIVEHLQHATQHGLSCDRIRQHRRD